MDKERFVEILRTGTYTEAHLEELNELVDEYPWFALPRFLRLKVYEQLETPPGAAELNRSVVFSSDRKHLYDWMKGTFESMIGTSGLGGAELEFMDSEDEEPGEGPGEEDPFVLLDDDVEKEDDADAKPIPEKDEAEMEEPEIEEPEAVPVMDSLDDEDDEDDEEDEENEEDEEDEEYYDDTDTAGKMPEDTKVADATNPSTDLIERFLKSEPGVIRADHQTNLEGDVSEGSVKEDDRLITDTLAKIYVKQGLHAKAIYAYERLSLKYPEKSAYFAAQIEKIKNNANV
jgi:hypothetical protein